MGLINEAKGPAKTLEDLTQRLLVLNFGAVHTTAFVQCSLFQVVTVCP
jgi:hypothetical protein